MKIMEWWIILIILLLYLVLEFISALIFNIKIKMVNQKRYTKAAALGAISTFVFVFLTSLSSYIAVTGGNNEISTDMWWFIIAAAFMMMLGNMLAVLAIIPVENFFDKLKNKKGKVKS